MLQTGFAPKLCYKRASRHKSSQNASPGKVVAEFVAGPKVFTERVAVDISSPVVGLIVRLLGVGGVFARPEKVQNGHLVLVANNPPQAFQTLGVVRVNCVTNKLCAQSRHRTRRRAESLLRTCRRRHLAARSGPSLTSSSRVEVFVPPERAQNGDLVWPACVPSGIFAWRPKGRVGNTELQ